MLQDLFGHHFRPATPSAKKNYKYGPKELPGRGARAEEAFNFWFGNFGEVLGGGFKYFYFHPHFD